MKKILLLLCLSIAGCNDYEYAVGSGENSPPVIDAEHIDELTSIEAFTGSSTTISILASDKDGDALVYSLLDNPDWVSMDGNVLTMKPLPGDVGTYQFKIIVSDGTASTEVNVSLTIQILMAPVDPDLVNHAPTITPLPTIKAIAGKVAIVDVTASDKDGDSLTYSLLNNPSWVSINGKTITINPTSVHTGNHQFKVRVSDGSLTSEVDAALVVNLPMTPVDPDLVNHAPTITPLPTIKAIAGKVAIVDVTASDKDGDSLTYSLLNNPSWVSINGKTITINPTSVHTGNHQFKVRVSDGSLTSEVDAALVVNLPMTPVDPDLVNHAPTITPLPTIKAVAGKVAIVDVTASDKDGDSLTYSLLNNPSWVSINGKTITINPTSVHTGNHQFKVRVSDGSLTSEVDAALVVNLPMTPVDPDLVNHAPTITPLPTIKAVAGKVAIVDVTASDKDGDSLTYSLLNNPSWVSINGKTITINPTSVHTGNHQFKVRVSDGSLTSEVDAVLVVNLPMTPVDPDLVNHAPTITPLPTIKAIAGKVAIVDVTASDKDGDSLTYSLLNNPSWVSINGKTITANPTSTHAGAHQFKVKVSDGSLTSEVDAVLVVNLPMTPVDPDLVNHAPTITPLPTIKAVAGKVAIVDVTASDKDGDSLTYSLLNNPSWVSINGKTITINPTSVHTGNHQFKVRVSDGSLTSEVDAVLVVNLPMTPVDPDLVNHAPIFITESIPSFNYEHGSMIDEKTFQVIAKDQDGDALMFSLEGAPPFISISKSGLLSVSPFRPDHVSDTLRVFYVVVSDGVLSVKIKAEIFVNYNSSPTIDSSDCVFDVINVNESIPVTASICTLKGSDPDGDAFQFVLQRGGNWASITQVTGTLTLMPTVKDIGKHELIVGTIDEYGATSAASIIPVTVTGNYGPDIEQIAPQKVIAEEREPLISHEWRVQASDPENDIIEYSLMDAPRWLSINKNGILSAMPGPSDKGLYSYKVKVKDAKGAFNIETGQVTVEANFKPVVQPIEDILTEVTKTQEFNVVQVEDPEGRSLTYMLVNAPAWASISNGIDDKGQLTFRTKEQDIGLYELTLRVSDGVLSTDDNIKVLVTPPMPENIKVSSHGRKRLVLSWDESIQDVYYKLYRNDEFLANSDKTSYLDVNVNDDAEYKYGISACKNEFCSKTAEISAINEGSDTIFINTVNYDAGLYNSFTTRLHYFDSNDKWVGYNYFIKDSGKIEFGDTYGDGKYRVDVTQQPKNGQVCTSNRGGKDYFSNGQDIEVAIDCTTPGQLTFNNDTIEISRYAKGVLGAKPSLFRISDNVEMQFSQIKFRSSNDDIVTVDQNTGAITSKGAIGEAIITAYFDSNFYGENVSASYRVNVVESNVHYAIEHVDLGQNVLTKPSQSIGITSGRDFLLRAFVYALDASNTTKPELLVKLSSNGKEVTLPLKCPEQLSTEKPVMPNYSLDGACYLKISDLSILDKDSSKMEIILLDNNTLSEYKYEVGVNLPYILRMKVIRIGYKGLIADYISPELLEKRIRRIMPFQGVQISYNHEPLDISDEASVSVFNVLRRVEQYRREFGEPGVTYIGVSPGGCSGGVAYLPGRTVVFQYRKTGCYNNVDSTIISFPHEVGHSLSIPHTVCNAEATVDKTWLNESLLWPGSKEGKNSTVPLLDMDENKIIDPNSNYPITTYDIMGYCGGEFLSEYNINNILRYLKGTTDYLPNKKSKLLTEVKKEKVLMISGLFDEGNVYLNKPKITQGTLYKNKGEYTVFVTTHNNQVIEADFEALNISHSDAKDFFINIPYIEGVKDMIFVDNKNNIYPVKDISEHQEK